MRHVDLVEFIELASTILKFFMHLLYSSKPASSMHIAITLISSQNSIPNPSSYPRANIHSM